MALVLKNYDFHYLQIKIAVMHSSNKVKTIKRIHPQNVLLQSRSYDNRNIDILDSYFIRVSLAKTDEHIPIDLELPASYLQSQ